MGGSARGGCPRAVAVATAAALWGWTAKANGPVDLVVPPRRYLRAGPSVRLHRLNIGPDDVTAHNRLAVTAVEIDGWAHHTNVDVFRGDRHRQNLLVNHGWRVLRFTYHDLVDRPDQVLTEIRAVLQTSHRSR